jgi:hypothetical protein
MKLAPSRNHALDRNGHFFTLSMSGIALPAAAQDIASAKPNIVSTDVTQGVKLELRTAVLGRAGDLFSSPSACA